MEIWLAVSTSVVTGFFTWRAAIGAQKLAAKREKENRESDLKLAEDRAQLRAVADYLRNLRELQGEWHGNSLTILNRSPSKDTLFEQVRLAIDSRQRYIRGLVGEVGHLLLYINNRVVAGEIASFSEALEHHNDLLKRQTPELRTYAGEELRNYTNKSKPRNLESWAHLRDDHGLDALVTEHMGKIRFLAKVEFNLLNTREFKGLFTPHSPRRVTNPSGRSSEYGSSCHHSP